MSWQLGAFLIAIVLFAVGGYLSSAPRDRLVLLAAIAVVLGLLLR